MAGAVIVKVDVQTWHNAFSTVRSRDGLVRAMTSEPMGVVGECGAEFHRRRSMALSAGSRESSRDALERFYSETCHLRLAKEGNRVVGGFVVLDGTLMGLWGRGIGDWLVREAISLGAEKLDCFDGYLPGFYAKHGFREILREPNITDLRGDVVWMRRV